MSIDQVAFQIEVVGNIGVHQSELLQ